MVWLELNQWRRPCLQGHANLVFEVGKQDRRYYYDQRQRRAVFDEIRAMAAMSMAETKLTGRRAADAAWRLAVETWLCREGHITVSVVSLKPMPQYVRKPTNACPNYRLSRRAIPYTQKC